MQDYMRSGKFWAGLIVALVLLFGVSAYNNFVTLDQSINGAWGKVEVQLQRRFDLIPNLVESVKGIFSQEKGVFGAISEARTKYGSACSPGRPRGPRRSPSREPCRDAGPHPRRGRNSRPETREEGERHAA